MTVSWLLKNFWKQNHCKTLFYIWNCLQVKPNVLKMSCCDEQIGASVRILGRELHQGFGCLRDVGTLLVPDLLPLLGICHHHVFADLPNPGNWRNLQSSRPVLVAETFGDDLFDGRAAVEKQSKHSSRKSCKTVWCTWSIRVIVRGPSLLRHSSNQIQIF